MNGNLIGKPSPLAPAGRKHDMIFNCYGVGLKLSCTELCKSIFDTVFKLAVVDKDTKRWVFFPELSAKLTIFHLPSCMDVIIEVWWQWAMPGM